jgi:replicative DNA helicase
MGSDAADTADLELERGVIASLLADNRGFGRLGQLEPEDFSDPTHAAVFAAALDLRAEAKRVDLVTLRSRFAAVPFCDGETVIDYLRGLEFAGNAPNISDMAASVQDLARRRDIKAVGEQISGSVYDHAVGPSVLLTDAARLIDDLLANCLPAGKTLWEMSEAVDDLLLAAANGDADPPIATGLVDYDKVTCGGLHRRQVVILGGRPGMGKSALAVVISHSAAKAGHGVIVFSLEMTKGEWTARMATHACWTNEAPIAFADGLYGELVGGELEIFRRAVEGLHPLPMQIEERSGLTASDIMSGTRRAAELFERQGKRLGLVVVDHLGKIRPSSRYKGQKVHEIGEISEAMTHLAKSQDVAVLALHQLNRDVEGRDNKRPTLVDLRDSGNLEQDAHTVVLAYRPAYYLALPDDDPKEEQKRIAKLAAKRHDLELQIPKQRNGPQTTIHLICDIASNAIGNASRGPA